MSSTRVKKKYCCKYTMILRENNVNLNFMYDLNKLNGIVLGVTRIITSVVFEHERQCITERALLKRAIG